MRSSIARRCSPFGFGLSYTNFKFENVRVEPAKIGPGGTAKVIVDVTNTGTREGEEVPQMYIHQKVSFCDAASDAVARIPAHLTKAGREEDGRVSDHAGYAGDP